LNINNVKKINLRNIDIHISDIEASFAL